MGTLDFIAEGVRFFVGRIVLILSLCLAWWAAIAFILFLFAMLFGSN